MGFPTLHMAWRSLWRNRRRTLITGSGVGLGLALMVFSFCWAEGLGRHMINVVTRSMLGHAQLHAPGYRVERETTLTIPDARELLEAVEGVDGVARAAPRFYGEALLAIGDRAEPVTALGFEPELEAVVTDWGERLVDGNMPRKSGELALGGALARKLEVEVGSRLVVTSSDVVSGELNYRLARVVGIISTDNPVLDKRTAFMPLTDAQGDSGLPGGVHEVALALTPDADDQEALTAVVARVLEATGSRWKLEGAPWQELSPMIAGLVELQGVYMAISLALVFFLTSFGIVNTMSMSLFERFREFGVMSALGTPPVRLAGLIVAEAGWLGVVGSALGLALGLAVTGWFAHTGIVFGSQTEAMGVGLGSPVYPVFDFSGIAISTLAFMALTPAISVLVAFRAAKIDPVRALRHE